MVLKTFITILKTEINTLSKWFSICFFIVLPFTFIPVVTKHGFAIRFLIERLPLSLVYSFGFSLFIVIIAIANDYKTYSQRVVILQKAAFANLGFYKGISGLKSGIESIAAFLMGQEGGYFFRLNIIRIEETKVEVEIVPVIDVDNNPEIKALLLQHYGFKDEYFFGLRFEIFDHELNDRMFLKKKLEHLSQELEKIHAIPIDIEDKFKKSNIHL